MLTTGENEQGLRKVIDLTRFGSIFILLLHFYFFCYTAFEQWNIQSPITDRLLQNIMHTGLFKNLFWSKLIALGLLVISLLGAQGKLEEKISKRSIAAYCAIGGLLFFGSGVLFQLKESAQFIAIIYMTITGLGFLLILAGGNLLSRLIKLSFTNDVFNSLNETFPQHENLLLIEYYINPPPLNNWRQIDSVKIRMARLGGGGGEVEGGIGKKIFNFKMKDGENIHAG